MTTLEAGYRWLVHHSRLRSNLGDGIIMGASSLSQLEQNLNVIRMNPLPSNMVEKFEYVWEKVKQDSPSYFRTSVKT